MFVALHLFTTTEIMIQILNKHTESLQRNPCRHNIERIHAMEAALMTFTYFIRRAVNIKGSKKYFTN
jgi:hypothetical protein